MKRFLDVFCLLGSFVYAAAHGNVSASDFHLKGDFLIGGLFNVHHVSTPANQDRPEVTDCSTQPFLLSSYRRLQLMRFAVEEINNSTDLLPNVTLGYDIFDHCSDTQNFPGIFKLISVDNVIQLHGKPVEQQPKVMAVVGPYTSTEARTLAPLLTMNLIPIVSYGASSSVFSRKQNFPSFLRTLHPNKNPIEAIVSIVQYFHWRWVAFLHVDNDYGNDGRQLFIERIQDTDICLGYTKSIGYLTDYTSMFKQIESQRIGVIIVLVVGWAAEALITSAIRLNVTDKVWIAGEAWSLNKNLPKLKGIESIGTVLGIAEPLVAIPGFSQFIHSTWEKRQCERGEEPMFCNQACSCSGFSAQELVAADPSFSFPVYAAVHAVARALHEILQCRLDGCKKNITVYPHMVLSELKKSNFTLLNDRIEFDENGDPLHKFYSIVFWSHRGEAEEVGIYKFNPSFHFFINNSKIRWYSNDKVPTSLCSPECTVGHAQNQAGIHKCCFTCEICPNGTYVNSTEDPYTCVPCKEAEWSAAGSTSCLLRAVEYVAFTDTESILIIIGACALVLLTVAMSVVFAINYNTPIVRSAGGPMCFLILGCLSLSSMSVFFYFGEPTSSFCMMRTLPFVLFYTVCLACFVVRSFQIVCIFKIAAKIPKLHSWWTKYHGQWLFIAGAFATQALFLLINSTSFPTEPYRDLNFYPDKILLVCGTKLKVASMSLVLLLLLCILCFIFSYMGKDLPKNYNEAKSITFCLLLLVLTWIVFATVFTLYRGKHIHTLNSLAILSSLYSFLWWYFFPKCYMIVFQPHKNTQKYFQGLIQSYTKTISQ
ncbi:taste receptor type 1 member 1-like [Nelusetta ayraudi]|uniref:taste receptor type 1 member 1-like n=1 Tax=Nelusetta ayraudi TaxID=303726 RepID=UPI003F70ADD5